MNSMQLKNDFSNAPSKMCFYKDLLFNTFPKGGTSWRPFVCSNVCLFAYLEDLSPFKRDSWGFDSFLLFYANWKCQSGVERRSVAFIWGTVGLQAFIWAHLIIYRLRQFTSNVIFMIFATFELIESVESIAGWLNGRVCAPSMWWSWALDKPLGEGWTSWPVRRGQSSGLGEQNSIGERAR